MGYEGDGQEGHDGHEEVNARTVEVGRVWRIGAVTAETPASKWENVNSCQRLQGTTKSSTKRTFRI